MRTIPPAMTMKTQMARSPPAASTTPMKQLPLIATRLYCEPWSILPTAHAEICRQFRAHLERGPAAADPEFDARQKSTLAEGTDDITGPAYRDEHGRLHAWHSQVEVRGSLAILPIRGITGKHLSTLDMYCGGCDTAIIARQARNIAADDRIENVIVYIDSPGGNCVGGIEAARAIRSMSEAGKSVIAYTDRQAASNGYFMASACDRILAAPSAIVGSISVYTAALDASRAYEMDGLEVKMFRTGEVKGMGYQGKPWTPAEEAAMQLVTEQFSQQFKSFVVERRGLGPADMQGQYWPAEFAPEGVIDGLVDDLDTLIAALTFARF
jgi:protease IV